MEKLVPALLLCALSGCFWSAGSGGPEMHLVRRGETLYGIAQRTGCDPQELQRLNGVRDPRSLQPGQRLLLPAPVRAAAPVPDKMAQLRGCFGRHGDSASCGPPKSSAGVRTISLDARSRTQLRALRWPVAGGRLASRFGYRFSSFHEGIDILAPSGTPVFASHDGVVMYSGDRIRGYGNLLVVRGDGIVSVYAHNRRNTARAGETVRRGSKIAEVGSTGNANGSHLHFEVRVRDLTGRHVAVDPMRFLAE